MAIRQLELGSAHSDKVVYVRFHAEMESWTFVQDVLRVVPRCSCLTRRISGGAALLFASFARTHFGHNWVVMPICW